MRILRKFGLIWRSGNIIFITLKSRPYNTSDMVETSITGIKTKLSFLIIFFFELKILALIKRRRAVSAWFREI